MRLNFPTAHPSRERSRAVGPHRSLTLAARIAWSLFLDDILMALREQADEITLSIHDYREHIGDVTA